MKEIPNANITITAGNTGGAWASLVTNSTETSTPTQLLLKLRSINY